MPTEIQRVRTMVKKFCEVVGVAPPHESAVLALSKSIRNLSELASAKAFRSMSLSWKYPTFPRPADWSGVIDQMRAIDETEQRKQQFYSSPAERPTDADWAKFNRKIEEFGVAHSIPEEDQREYLSPEEAMIGWKKRQNELQRSISHLESSGLIGKTGTKKKEKVR